MNIYEFVDYKKFIKKTIRREKRTYSQLATECGVQKTYISMVINGDHHLNEEQAYQIGLFLMLDEEELDYFILLVRYARGGRKKYRDHLLEKINNIRKDKLKLSKRLSQETDLVSIAQKSAYYDYYLDSKTQEVHMLLMIPKYQKDIELIAKKLSISLEKVREILNTLLDLDVIEAKEDRYLCKVRYVHLENGSLLSEQNHVNTRLLALKKEFNFNGEDYRFSAVICADPRTKKKLKKEILDLIVNFQERLKNSHPKEIYQLNIDFFQR